MVTALVSRFDEQKLSPTDRSGSLQLNESRRTGLAAKWSPVPGGHDYTTSRRHRIVW